MLSLIFNMILYLILWLIILVATAIAIFYFLHYCYSNDESPQYFRSQIARKRDTYIAYFIRVLTYLSAGFFRFIAGQLLRLSNFIDVCNDLFCRSYNISAPQRRNAAEIYATERLHRLQDELLNAQEEHKQYIENQNARTLALEAENTSIKSQLEQEINNSIEDAQKANSLIQDHEKTIRGLRQYVRNLEYSVEKKEKQMESLQKSLKEAHEIIDEMSQESEPPAAPSKSSTDYTTAITPVPEPSTKAVVVYQRMQPHFEEKMRRKNCTSLKTWKAKLGKAIEERKEADRHIGDLNKQLELATSTVQTMEDIEVVKGERDTLQKQVEEMRTTFNHQADEAMIYVNKVVAERNELQVSINGMSQHILKIEKLSQQRENEVRVISQERDQIKAEYEALSKGVQALKQKRDQLQGLKSALEQKLHLARLNSASTEVTQPQSKLGPISQGGSTDPCGSVFMSPLAPAGKFSPADKFAAQGEVITGTEEEVVEGDEEDEEDEEDAEYDDDSYEDEEDEESEEDEDDEDEAPVDR